MCSYPSPFQTKQHHFLPCPVQKLLHQFSYSQPRLNTSVIFCFICEVCFTLQGHFALPVYLQDLHFPFSTSIFFLNLESSFGSFRSSNNLDHTSCTQKTNPFISLTSEVSCVTEHWKSGVEIPNCLCRNEKITSEIDAALPSRGLLHVKKQTIQIRYTHLRFLTKVYNEFLCA